MVAGGVLLQGRRRTLSSVRQTERSSPIMSLPNELIYNIAKRLSVKDLRNFGEAHHQFRVIADYLMPAKIQQSQINSQKIFNAIAKMPLTETQAAFLDELRENVGRFINSPSQRGIVLAEERFRFKNYLRNNKMGYEEKIVKWDIKSRYKRLYGQDAKYQIREENFRSRPRTWWDWI